ncbi:host specificity protein J, partial [Escherichia coli]
MYGDSPCRHCVVACSAVSPSGKTRTGTFAITAVQHVPEKEAIVDNGASFEPQSGTLNSVIPPAVQHLTVEVSAADGQYLA